MFCNTHNHPTPWQQLSLWVLLCNDPEYGSAHRAALCVMDTWRKRWRRTGEVQRQDRSVEFLKDSWLCLDGMFTWKHANGYYVKPLQWIKTASVGFGILRHLLTSEWTTMSSELQGAITCSAQFPELPVGHKSELGQASEELVVIQHLQQMTLQINICGPYWTDFPISSQCRRPHVKRRRWFTND